MKISIACELDSSGQWLAVQESTYNLLAILDRAPVLRIHYMRDQGSRPSAHVHVHGHRGALSHLLSQAGHDSPHDMSSLHIPVGGSRYRPCLEDFIQFLICECRFDSKDGWKATSRRAASAGAVVKPPQSRGTFPTRPREFSASWDTSSRHRTRCRNQELLPSAAGSALHSACQLRHRPQTVPVGYAIDIAYWGRRRRRQGAAHVDGVGDRATAGGRPAVEWPEWSARRGDVANVVGGGGLGTIIRLGGLCVGFCQRSEVACRGRRSSCSSG
jgi:hypothetical protein